MRGNIMPRALKQRNSLLKSRRNLSLSDLEPWNIMLSDYGEILHAQRSHVVEQWVKIFRARLESFIARSVSDVRVHCGLSC